ncbi:MAG: InlB B-repeat-containing protein, partial [Paludibacteraceae bacterium]|nr:InlB B-repeat-containing protein [Paludibacteraceae bacterium]
MSVGVVATGYQFDGWYTAATGGTQLSASTTYTYYPTSATTVYARFSEKMSTVTLSASPSGKGSFTIGGAAATSTSVGVTTTKSVTAVPASGYHFVSWAVSGGATISSTTANPVTVTGTGAGTAATLTATFEANDVHSLTVAKETGISSVTGSTSPVTLGTKYPISATVATGYNFGGWTASPTANGTFDNASSTSTNVTVKNGSVTVTASATENMSTLTTSNSYDVGNPNYAVPTKSASSIGIATTATLTAKAAGTGYTFAGWTLSNNLVVTGGNAATDRTITVRTNGDGAAATAQANYTEDLTTTWYINGDANGTSPFSGWGTSGTPMLKKTGHSTEEIYYCTIHVGTTATSDGFGFKAYNSAGADDAHRYYAYSDREFTKAQNSCTLYTNNNANNMKFKPYLTGDYEFKLDNTGTNPILTVTWPEINQVRISAANPANAANVGNFDMGAAVSNVRTVTRSLAANTTYTFKVVYNSDWYGFTSGEFTRSNSTSSNSLTVSTSGGDMKLKTDYAGDYTFNFNQSTKALSVTYPTAYTVTFGYGTGGSAVTATVEDATTITSGQYAAAGKDITFTQIPAAGYTFKEWNTQSDGKGAQLSTSATYNHTVGATNSVYAIYEPASYDITYDPASPTNFAYTLKPTTGVYNSTVSVTIIPAQNYKITSVTAAKTEASGTSVSVTHTTATNVYSFTQPAYGVTLTTTAAAYGLTATATADYVAKTFTLGNTSTLTPEGTKGTNWFVYYTCTAKPDGANCSINQSTGVATVDKIGNYTFKAQFRTADSGAGTLLAESSGNTIEMKDFPNYSGIAPTTAIIGSSYMNGSGISESPYFVYSSHFNDAKTLTLNISGVGESDDVYCAVDGANEQSMTGSGTSRTATITLPSNTIEANKTTAVTVYAKVDGQTAPAEKRATATVYYTVNTDPVVTVTATYNGNPVAGNLPQSATIELAASVTEIPGEPTFTYSKGSGAYTSTTSYTINETGTTIMHAKTTYLGDWIGDFNITTYTANAVTLKTVKTDMYGDDAESSTSRLFNSAGEEYTAPDIEGYTFAGWSCDNSNVQVSDDSGSSWKSTSSNATVYVKATAAGGTLTATYNENKRIYFDNSKAKWSGEIYVYLFNGNAWYDNYSTVDQNGPGVVPKLGTKVEYGHMTRIGESDIYYYEYSYGSSFSRVAFSVGDQNNYDMLYATKAVWRTDFSTCNPVYVAPATHSEIKYNTGGEGKSGDNKPTYYYNTGGYWRRYMPQYAPYSLYMVSGGVFSNSDQGKFVPENPAVDGENFTKEILLAGTTTYYFNLPSSCGGSYGNNGEMTKDNCTNWTFEKTSGSIGNCRITTTAEGTYIFHLSTANGQVKLSVEYPLSVGDYRIHYTDATGKNDNYSDYIRKNTGSEAKKDTVSFFVAKNSTPKYQVEKCNSFDGSGNPEWITVGEAQSLSVDKDGVYIFVFEQPAGGESISKIAQDTYSGNYYIRTDGASGGWANYLSDPDNRMKYTDKASAAAAGYNYYYLRWIGDASGNSTANVKFVIANDYNSSVSQEMGNDAAEGSLSGGQALTGQGANVRFTYHSGTNRMTRTYIGGSGHDANYLVLEAVDNSKLNTSAGGSWSTTKLEDQNDWIYTLELRAKAGAEIMLKSHYNNKYV